VSDSRWNALTGKPTGRGYAQRFAELAASGADVHGEAAFCAALLPVGAVVLDAGCGTGRVAIRLAELGFRCVGIDADASMLDQARAAAPALPWVHADLGAMDGTPDIEGPFDLVVAAGNVIPLLAPGTEADVIRALSKRLVAGGLLVAGFGLDAAHLPLDEAPFGIVDYDLWCTSAGLAFIGRYSTWQGAPYAGDGYAVSVHRLATWPVQPDDRFGSSAAPTLE
jgi:SAM-dependent methyltransferase